MGSLSDTRDQTAHEHTAQGPASPGVVLVFEAGKPRVRAFAVPRSGLEFGRGQPDGALEADDRVSRRHLSIDHARGSWGVRDLGSRNGTFVDGVRIDGYVDSDEPVLIRLGKSLLWTVPDVTPYLGLSSEAVAGETCVVGGLLARAWREVELSTRASDTLLVRGESGTGKELAARHMHEVCFGKGSRAPFVAVNCAAIPEGLAERLLFGARRGAYSGASDAQGYIAAADGGTLFLDEIAELDLAVQAKLLRVLETREVLPLGESRARPVQLRLCSATHENLREAVAAGRFREDLYFRLGRPEVVLPPLAARIDELPWLIAAELARHDAGLRASVGFVEACALRPWPGNVRELLGEVRLVAHRPLEAGATQLEAHHLSPEAGQPLASREPAARAGMPDDARISAVLAELGGNVSAAAKRLGLHRNQLRRWLDRRSKTEKGATDE
jgi:transcriptional regulator of acetoin/glycerol metabolism